ncbi:MAG TPA: 16S rRNA (uracil(1498)-N(3))-methyltransferase [Steroidobacteraceae bacterium]|nr:16S rRNA (uracil(1498)-N(3))-methyltransferase [Steroidobacteraceae bacterium]
MRLTRVYVDGPVTLGEPLTVEGSAANHITRVLRLRVGDPLTVFDGSGGEFGARIEEFRKDTVRVCVDEHRELDRESPLSLTLMQGISRGERMDWVIQKATELGTSRIVPVFTKRSVVRLDDRQVDKKLQHWRGVAVAACEQCGRNRVPEVTAPKDFFDALPPEHLGTARILLSPAGSLRIDDLQGHGAGISVLIGPEGGLEDTEQEAALAAGFKAVRLGPRILRTETAAIAALTIIQRYFGDL